MLHNYICYSHHCQQSVAGRQLRRALRARRNVTQILDACAPLRSTTKRISTQMHRFLSDEARSAKRACRRAERRFRRTGSTNDRAKFKKARKTARHLIDESRVSQIRREIADADGDPKRLWRTTKQLLHPQTPSTMNDNDYAAMASKFCSFFHDKVDRIRASVKCMSLGQRFSAFQVSHCHALAL